MSEPLELEYSDVVPAAADRAYDLVLGTPLEQIFDRRFWAIPPVVGVRDQVGEWERPGQSRTIVLADRGTMREEITLAEPPGAYGYEISHVTGPLKPLVASARGSWTFAPDGAGTRITWRWTVQPRNRAAALAMPLFAFLWRGNARLGFDRLKELARG